MGQGPVSHAPDRGSGLVDRAGPLAAATKPAVADDDIFSFLSRLSNNASPPAAGISRQQTSPPGRGAGSVASPEQHLPRPGRKDGVPPVAAVPPAASGLAAPQLQIGSPPQPSALVTPQPGGGLPEASSAAEGLAQRGSTQANLGCPMPVSPIEKAPHVSGIIWSAFTATLLSSLTLTLTVTSN